MKMKRAVKYLVALALVIAMVGCGSDSEEEEEDLDPLLSGESSIGIVSMEILYPDAAEMEDILDAQANIYEDADTVLDALVTYGKEEDLSVVVEKGVYTYVTGIGGVFEKDFGEATGWVFTVNEEAVMEGASDCTLSDGDQVVWEYVDYSDTEM